MQRSLPALGCVLLVVLAGCSLGPGSQPAPTTDASDSGASDDATTAPADETTVSTAPTTTGDTRTATPAATLQFELGARIGTDALADAHVLP